MKPLELLWFENISAFHEPVLALGPIRASMKQLLYTLLALALALSLLNFAKNLVLAIALPAFFLMLAYARPYGQGLEELLIDMVSFFGKRKSIGIGTEERKERKEKGKDKDRDRKEKVEVTETAVSEQVQAVTTTPTPMQAEPVVVEVGVPPPSPLPSTPAPTTPATAISSAPTSTNLLHYIVPSTRDFDLEIADKEYVIVTGESTIHINNEDHNNAVVVIEVKDKAVARITVNKEPKQ